MQISFCPPGLLKEVALLMSSDTSEEMMQEVTRIFSLRSRLLYSIRFYSAEQWDSWLGSGKSMADITGYKENRELGRQNGRVYVYTEPAQSEQGLSEEELPSYRQAVAAIPAMHTYAVMLEVEQAPPVPAKSRNSLPDFSTQDIYGTALDSSIFADYDLTMLNIWGTFCGPCIMEMPYLGEMAAAMPAGTQMVGLVGDAIDQETIKMAQNIAEETGAIYPHIVPDKALGDFLNRNIQFFPTTLFIDNAGNIVGEPVVGAVSREKYEEELNKRLDKINEQ
jgi:thiol-disulfide isomerase/thioredoxin